MSKLPAIEPRRVCLDMNISGAWRSLGVFDLDVCDSDAVLDAAETLVINNAGQAGKGKLRITLVEQPKTVLMYWSQDAGWQESRHAR